MFYKRKDIKLSKSKIALIKILHSAEKAVNNGEFVFVWAAIACPISLFLALWASFEGDTLSLPFMRLGVVCVPISLLGLYASHKGRVVTRRILSFLQKYGKEE